ncbi:MAG: hypothetical protein ACK5GR_06945, partial [Akkermansiaceae bacterium]|nr:hypothetical protein [Luteolibacter sp.]
QPGALRPRPGQAVVSLSTPAVSLMFFTQFPELQEADISCPVIAGDATQVTRVTFTQEEDDFFGLMSFLSVHFCRIWL